MTSRCSLRRAGTGLAAVALLWATSAGTASAQDPTEALDPSTITDLLPGGDEEDSSPLDAITDPLSDALPLPGDDGDEADDGDDGDVGSFGDDGSGDDGSGDDGSGDEGGTPSGEDAPLGGVDAGFGGLAGVEPGGEVPTGLAAALLAAASAAWVAAARRTTAVAGR